MLEQKWRINIDYEGGTSEILEDGSVVNKPRHLLIEAVRQPSPQTIEIKSFEVDEFSSPEEIALILEAEAEDVAGQSNSLFDMVEEAGEIRQIAEQIKKEDY